MWQKENRDWKDMHTPRLGPCSAETALGGEMFRHCLTGGSRGCHAGVHSLPFSNAGEPDVIFVNEII